MSCVPFDLFSDRANGRTVFFGDNPAIGQEGSVGDKERTLYIAMRFCSSAGCNCRLRGCVTIRVKQHLKMDYNGFGEEPRLLIPVDQFPVGDPPETDETGG